MEYKFFDIQIKRLEDNFGAKHYSSEKRGVLFKSMKQVSDQWFSEMVDYFIGNSNKPPLLEDFGDRLKLMRERAQRKNKFIPQDFSNFKSSYSDSERKHMMQTIVDRMHGKVPDETWEQFYKLINYQAAQTKIKCEKCEDSGVLFKIINDCEFVFKCTCQTGKNNLRRYQYLF